MNSFISPIPYAKCMYGIVMINNALDGSLVLIIASNEEIITKRAYSPMNDSSVIRRGMQ